MRDKVIIATAGGKARWMTFLTATIPEHGVLLMSHCLNYIGHKLKCERGNYQRRARAALCSSPSAG